MMSSGPGTGLDQIVIKPAERRNVILHAIALARVSIHLSMFRCTDFKVLDALSASLQRGVSVQLLLTQRVKGWEQKIREIGDYLEGMGATVHRYALPDVKYHAKYIVVDDSVAIISSANLTTECFTETADFLLRTEDPGIVTSLVCLFERDIAAPGKGLPAKWSPRLIAGPEISRTGFSRLLSQVRENLRIVDHRITDPRILAVLHERERAGVEIRIYGKRAMRRIKSFGKHGLRSHGKMMILDGKCAVLGSISMSPPGLGNRRELAVMTEDAECLRALERFFVKAGAGIPLGDLKSIASPVEDEEEDADA
jgi:cardiolipin synthase A/B